MPAHSRYRHWWHRTTARARRTARWLLLGPEHAWGAHKATSLRWIKVLALVTLITNGLDLATGLRMMLVHGVALEQNPLVRQVMYTAGPLLLVVLKVGVVLGGVFLLMQTARVGRARLARNCLALTAGIGVLGAASNLVI